jgi:hypothetical protein
MHTLALQVKHAARQKKNVTAIKQLRWLPFSISLSKAVIKAVSKVK